VASLTATFVLIINEDGQPPGKQWRQGGQARSAGCNMYNTRRCETAYENFRMSAWQVPDVARWRTYYCACTCGRCAVANGFLSVNIS